MNPVEMQHRALRSFREAAPDWSRWVDPQADGKHISPLTSLPLPLVPSYTKGEVEGTFAAARDARLYWAQLRPGARGRYLRHFESLMWKYQDQILDVIQWETGKARQHAFDELLDVSASIGFLTGHAPRILRTSNRPGALPVITRARVAHLPVGVVGIIAPWNYPFTLAASDAAAALMAGNPVVLKPASNTPLSAIIVASLLGRAGLPPETFQLVFGAGESVGSQIVDHSDYVMFTGSTAAGRVVGQQCARRLIGFSAELGGKNPSVIFADADLNQWARSAMSEYFSSAGQLCVSIERVYVHEKVWDDAVARLVAATESLAPGRDFGWQANFGPLVSESQLHVVERQVQDAVDKGAKVLTGGHRMPELGPTGYAPTLLTDVTPDMEIYGEETFGPVVSLYPWSDPDRLFEEVNQGDLGLHASVWTREARVARDMAQEIKAGSVSINGDFRTTWGAVSAPIGGMRASGLGRRHGAEGLLKYTESQTVAFAPRGGMGPWFGMEPHRWAELERTVIRARNLF